MLHLVNYLLHLILWNNFSDKRIQLYQLPVFASVVSMPARYNTTSSISFSNPTIIEMMAVVQGGRVCG